MSVMSSPLSFSVHDNSNPSPPPSNLSTGIGFLDHMLDQIQSHAQVTLTMPAGVPPPAELSAKIAYTNRNKDQGPDLYATLGTSLGVALLPLLPPTIPQSTTFHCPLDESVVKCVLQDTCTDTGAAAPTCTYNLSNPVVGGVGSHNRLSLGSMSLPSLPIFWQSLATSLNLNITLTLITGNNAHHIIEASFKAFSRALRLLLDDGKEYKVESKSERRGVVERVTKETFIECDVRLDGDGTSQLSTGITTLTTLLTTFFASSSMSATVSAQGDLWIDDHHLIEDLGIALGQCVKAGLGGKVGCNRMWSETYEGVTVVLDLSGRPFFQMDLELSDDNVDCGTVAMGDVQGSFSVEMFDHLLDSLLVTTLSTAHVTYDGAYDGLYAGPGTMSNFSRCNAAMVALGRCLKKCKEMDVRREGKAASSKGTLSA